jgi:hypothetical protein
MENENATLNTINIDSVSIKPTTPATRANLEPSATVKFVLMPFNQVVTLACSLRSTIKELKAQFAQDLKIEEKYLEFIYSNESINIRKSVVFFLF